MYKAFVFLIIIFFIIYLSFPTYEHYYDTVPYNIQWDLDKCLTGSCVIKKSYDCYKYCDNIADSSSSQHCQMNCLDIGDEMFDNLKWQNYNWPLDYSNKYFKKYSLLNSK